MAVTDAGLSTVMIYFILKLMHSRMATLSI